MLPFHVKQSTMKSTSKSLEPWKEEYRRLWLQHHNKKFPEFFRGAADPYVYLRWPNEKKANGLTKLICTFLTWKGHHSNRINTQGQARVQKVPRYNIFTESIQTFDKVTYTKSMTKRGTPDISAIINGRAVMIEIKVGRDRLSEDQLKQMSEIEAAGGIYFVARDMPSFYEWYYKTFAA